MSARDNQMVFPTGMSWPFGYAGFGRDAQPIEAGGGLTPVR